MIAMIIHMSKKLNRSENMVFKNWLMYFIDISLSFNNYIVSQGVFIVKYFFLVEVVGIEPTCPKATNLQSAVPPLEHHLH